MSSSSGGRPAKIARHDRLLGAGINHSTLLRVIDLVRGDVRVLDDVQSRFQLYRRGRQLWGELQRTLELPRKSGAASRKSGPFFTWEIASFSKLLNRCLERCDVLREEVLSLYSREPCLPGREWELIIYF